MRIWYQSLTEEAGLAVYYDGMRARARQIARADTVVHFAGMPAGTYGGKAPADVVINMGAMIGPMVMQPAIGWMLDRKWNGAVVAGVRVYDADAYRAGFALMLAWLAVSVLVLAFARETHARQAP